MVICVSNATRDDVEEIYGEEIGRKSIVIPNPIDAVKIRDLMSRGHMSPVLRSRINGAPFCVYIGTRDGTKNFKESLTLLNADNNLHLIVVGPPPTAAETAALYAFDRRVHFVGRLTDSDMFFLLSKSNFLFTPSLLEGFGMPIAESMALGVPVVGLDTKINQETSGCTVMAFQTGDEESLAKAIGAASHDSAHSQARVSSVLERYNPSAVADQYISVFEHVFSQ
jgi:glycosyltransferase involved in cell wall biosynthesis